MKKLFFLLILAIASFSCKEKEIKIPEGIVIPDTDRVVMIEELTGVSCPNCPGGSAEIASIKELFGDKIVAVGIHSNFLANPLPESQYDFRSPFAQSLDEYLGLYDGKPAASINRVHFNNEDFLLVGSTNKWTAFVQEQLNIAPIVEVGIENDYNATSRELNSTITISPLQNISGEFTLTVYITENHIVDYQKDVSVIYPEFEHEHVLKVKLNENIKGDALADDLTVGNVLTKSYSYTLPEADTSGPWIPENCTVIAFVSEITSSTKEILQAAEEYVN